jgi:hypothetical protein
MIDRFSEDLENGTSVNKQTSMKPTTEKNIGLARLLHY